MTQWMLAVMMIWCVTQVNAQEALLPRIDATMDSIAYFDALKERRIDGIKSQLVDSVMDGPGRYTLLKALYEEYQTYICDSAIHYAKELLAVATTDRSHFWRNEASLQLARAYAAAGLYHEALPLLGAIDKMSLDSAQLPTYYLNYVDTYIYLAEFVGEQGVGEYSRQRMRYEDSAMVVLPERSYSHLILAVTRKMADEDFAGAATLLRSPELSALADDTREYAIVASIKAYYNQLIGDTEGRRKALALSAMADIRASVKENLSFRNLAETLLGEGDASRANRYIKKSMDDANFYNARLRNIQIAKVFPIIDRSYQLEREEQQRRLKLLLAAVSLLSVFLVLAITRVIRQNNKLKKARQAIAESNRELQQLNGLLSESNHIKEAYVGRFLDLCSSYIDKMEDFRKTLNKKAVAGKFDELSKQLKHRAYLDDELREFYQNFDEAFLNIFPDFVSQFNNLFAEEDRVYPKQPNGLLPELRIFALMRLGITDGTKIANFLRLSVTTIYNYRSKYRNKALVRRDDFEGEISKIGNISLG